MESLLTDLEKLRELLQSWGVPFVELDWEEPAPLKYRGRTAEGPPEKAHNLRVGGVDNEVDAPTVEGYSGFFTDFVFTPEGRFLRMGAWE